MQSAIEDWVTRERDAYTSDDPKLWASDMGKCPRKAILRVTGLAQPSVLPDTKMQLYFQAGNMWEDDTARALRWKYGAALTEQLVLKDEAWSGKCDFALYHGDDSRQPVLIEHKAKGDKWWNYKGELPQSDHVGQLYIYRHLYKKLYNREPKLVLFYRSWGHYAEFYLDIGEDHISIHGTIDGEAVALRRSVDLSSMRQELEQYYVTGEVPPRLADKEAGCTFQGKPSCPYYHFCWPKYEPEDARFMIGIGAEKTAIDDIRF